MNTFSFRFVFTFIFCAFLTYTSGYALPKRSGALVERSSRLMKKVIMSSAADPIQTCFKKWEPSQKKFRAWVN